jgi:DNA-binding PadR family transcriptional regulator
MPAGTKTTAGAPGAKRRRMGMKAERKRAMSGPTVAVLRALAEGATYGFDVMDVTGLSSGTVYPILSRAEKRGLVESRWEAAAEHRREGRPARKYYRLTAEGRTALAEAVGRFRALGRPLRSRA